ncbi:MAG: hypothetical protein E6883_11815 [Lactococcus lactis]|nr:MULTISPECIES: hypothetical protein [Lactococcus]MDU1526929.1 hypothetical protein [Lactococcus lactis]MDU2186525.1 hypothetical protein [Lactococcus lactis]
MKNQFDLNIYLEDTKND